MEAIEAEDTLARVLGLIGVLTGVAGTVIALFAYFRDRPKLAVSGERTFHLDEGEARKFSVRIAVANHGRQPISVTSVGAVIYKPGRRRRQAGYLLKRLLRVQAVRGGDIFLTANEEPLLLSPGAIQQFELDADLMLGPGGIPEGTVVQVYAKDSRDRIIYGRGRFPLLRPSQLRS